MKRKNIPQKDADVIQKFLNKFSSKSTRASYRSNLKRFFNYLNEDPDKYIKECRLLEKKDLLPITDKYEEDIGDFILDLEENKIPPKTITAIRNTLRVFFRSCRIPLDDTVWDDLRRRNNNNNQVLTEDKPINTDILEKILIQGSTKARAFFLTLASSGMRVGELCSITLKDVEWGNPTKITIPAGMAKNNIKRYTFISKEATKYLKEWLKIRDKYLITACKRSTLHDKNPNDDRLFPFEKDSAREMWVNLIKKSGHDEKDEKTDRYVYHIHGLRKFFRSYFPNIDIAELLMGHEGYLTKSYRRIDEDTVRETYLNSMSLLSVFEHPMTNKEQEELFNKQQERISELENTLEEALKTMDALFETTTGVKYPIKRPVK